MSCLFCAIVAGDIPSRQVYADEHAYAFLDINPFTRGHTLVVPRRHVDDVLAPDEALSEIAPAISEVSRLLVERLGADGLNVLAVSGAALLAASVWQGETWPARWDGLALVSLAFQTVVISFASYLVWFWLVRHYPATRISVFLLLTPVFGLFAGVGLLGEPLGSRLVLALAAVCVGIALVNRRAAEPA